MKLQWIMAAVIAITFASATIAADKAKDDAEAILGSWKMESGQRGGEDAPDDVKKNFKLTFAKDGKLIIALMDGQTEEGTFKLDSTKKPKELTLNAMKESKEAIYDLDGDTLKICMDSTKDGKRPSKFESPKDTRIILMVLKRDK